jgi:hypothetical protein
MPLAVSFSRPAWQNSLKVHLKDSGAGPIAAARSSRASGTDGCLVRRFFHPHYLQTNAYHLRILGLPSLNTLSSAACCANC